MPLATKGAMTEIAINQKYNRGTFDRSNHSAINAINRMNKLIAAKVILNINPM